MYCVDIWWIPIKWKYNFPKLLVHVFSDWEQQFLAVICEVHIILWTADTVILFRTVVDLLRLADICCYEGCCLITVLPPQQWRVLVDYSVAYSAVKGVGWLQWRLLSSEGCWLITVLPPRQWRCRFIQWCLLSSEGVTSFKLNPEPTAKTTPDSFYLESTGRLSHIGLSCSIMNWRS